MITAQVMAGSQVGGAELFYERLCIGLHRAGDVVLPVIRADPARKARLSAAGLRPRGLRFGSSFDPITGWRLRHLLRAARPAVVMAWMGRAATATPAGAWSLVGRLGGYYSLKRFAHCDHLVANTGDIRDWIVGQGWPEARVHLLPNFVPDLYGGAPADRTELGLPAQATILLGLGRLHEAKGFDTLIQALTRLDRVHLVIAGEGPARPALERLARDLGVAGRVHLPGWRHDTGALLALADVFVCSSRHEPLGNMVLEAWSAGRPVVATASQGPRALIRHDQTGLLVPVEDPAALAGAVAAVLAAPDRANALAAAGRAAYEAGFTEPAVLAQWRSFLASVAR